MKNFRKGLWAVILCLGFVFIPGLTLVLADGSIPMDINEEGTKKGKDKKETILAICDIHPVKLNLKSKGKWITAYIELPKEYDLHDINLEEIKLNEFLSPEIKPFNIGDRDNNDIPDLMVKFDRSEVIDSLVEPSQFCEMTIKGKIFDRITFTATCVIELINF